MKDVFQRGLLRLRMGMWRRRHALIIRATRSWKPDVRATCLGLFTGVPTWFVHDALYPRTFKYFSR